MLCHFLMAEIWWILPLLHLDDVSWMMRNKPSQETAFCLLLCQLAYPGCLVAITDHFGWSPSWCSAVFNNVAIHLWTTFQGILEWHPLITYKRMALFAEAISDLIESRDGLKPPGYLAGEESAVVWGFIDGTFRGFC